MKAELPKKLKHDAIVEAICEIRFECDDIGEVVVGRLSDFDKWEDFKTERLSSADIPAPIRDNDPNLKYSPTIVKRLDNLAIRIGPRVISCHYYEPYPGWDKFFPLLCEISNLIFERTKNTKIVRVGFRYVNFLRSDKHKINSLNQLELSIQAANEDLSENVNLSFLRDVTKDHTVYVRVATPNYIAPEASHENLVVIIDVDVATPINYVENSQDSIIKWIDEAHNIEKEYFFGLIPLEIQKQLQEG